ncbi:hypothetical protein [Nostoc sp. WHI]|uniref:hypothetical protein n=1 Tax=Nostoc sp. WHI TaxID=2650611 RepID=UPI0018C71AFE|nr:hypothetical protein [Nostoc sp. WHI]MBG1266239.1 hypothetical protein [Nostoc sp. WHI]
MKKTWILTTIMIALILSIQKMNMRQPIFSADEAAVQQAIRQAKAKATVLATEANVELAGIFYIEELSTVKRNSGVYGDEDWFGDSMRFGMNASERCTSIGEIVHNNRLPALGEVSLDFPV